MPFSNLSSYALGLVFIFLVAIIWSIASIVVQYLYRDQSFDAPFLLTYIGTSLFVVQLPLHWFYKRWMKLRSNSGANGTYENIPTTDDDSSSRTDEGEGNYQTVHLSENNGSINNGNVVGEPSVSVESDRHWTEKDHMIAGAKLSPFWFISNFAYNASLEHTSITSSTVLVNTGSLFTFLIALLMRDERFSCWKLIGVIFGIVGCVVTGLHDARNGGGGGNGRMRFLFVDTNESDTNDDHHLWGDILSVISAAFYGIYAVMVRLLCPRDESLMSMQLFLGYVGLWNMLALFPIALYQLKIAQSVTLSGWVFSCLVVNGLFNNVISDYLWARSVVLTSATVASVGLGLTIPLAFVSDVFLGVEDILNLESILGACFVLSGFILVNIGHTKNEGEEDNERNRTSSEDEDFQSTSMQPVSSEIDMVSHQNLS